MPVYGPNLEELSQIATEMGMSFSPSKLQEHLDIMGPNFDVYNLIDQLPDHKPEVKYSRDPGYQPDADENPLGAWYRKTSIKGAADGPLSGKKIVLKDNIQLAGVPMMNGSSTLEGFVPDFDATVVTRILDAGGEIVGKAHCEHFCLSGGSHTNSKGAVHNPHKQGYSSGGSSSGCGALVGSGEVEMAIGGDQGGSIRMPASWSGCVGMKATWGLVPYTGVMPIEATIDYAGPITNNVSNNALLLETIAGKDGLDPRQYDVETHRYTEALKADLSGLKIGMLTEGFGRDESEDDVDEAVRVAAEKYRALGAEVDEISIPWHITGHAIWLAVALEGLTEQMMLRNGMGLNWRGQYSTSLIDHHANWRERADELSDSLKSCMLTGYYMLQKYRGKYYAKAQNLNQRLRAEYDKALEQYDALLMPTMPMKATPLPEPDAPTAEYVQRAFEMVGNTCPFDISGHPAISIPCGVRDSLPVGMMLVGSFWGESKLYQMAYGWESATDWKKV